MKIYSSLDSFPGCKNPVVTTGTFDGVHKGHRKMIDRLKEIARKNEGETVLMTFYPHPRMVLFPHDTSLKLLSTQREKAQLLADAGIDHLIVYPFSKEFSRFSALEYVRELLVNGIGTHTLVVGYDHHFGRNREGNFENLKEYAQTFGFEVEEIPALEVDDVNVSSTKIRRALAEGDLATARNYLGYAYSLTGVVVGGDQIGTKIGYPTANVVPDDSYKLIPGNGVYAIKARLNEQVWEGMLNIGHRPTLGEDGDLRIEAHLFGLEHEIYGETLTLEFIARIRDEERFESLDQLKERIHADKQVALSLLKTE